MSRSYDVTHLRLPGLLLDIAAGDNNNNCSCLDEHHRDLLCPQHPQESHEDAGGETP